MEGKDVSFGPQLHYKSSGPQKSLYDRYLSATLSIITRNDYEFRHPSEFSGEDTLIRLTPASYTDGYNSMAGQDRPSPREISNIVCDQTANVKINNPENLTDMFWLWGQYLDHDMTLSVTNPLESEPIEVPNGDIFFDPENTGNVTIPFSRHKKVEGTGVMGTPREQFVEITPEIDATNVYCSTTSKANWIRSLKDGKLKVLPGGLLPLDNGENSANDGPDNGKPFVAGDVRANENVALLSIHNLWVREHNWWCDQIKRRRRSLTDQEIYDRARMMVEAEIQAITFNEFLPLLLGSNQVPAYSGYKSETDTSISNEFSTVAFRLGHSLISNELLRLDSSNTEIPEGNLLLKDAFFSPQNYANTGTIDHLLRGLTQQICQNIDTRIVTGLRNFLFGEPGQGGLDLASINIQRGRDHGLPDYNTMRVELGLGAKTNFNEITSDPEIATALSSAYGGDISKIDPWVGGLAEDHVHGSQLGELFHTICKEQFLRSREGDEYWYERRLSKTPLKLANLTTLSTVIKRNTGIKRLRKNVFVL
jgi:hypothetical protein